MGTYLHPRTEEPKHLEIIAGVPKGTYVRLMQLREEAEEIEKKTTEQVDGLTTLLIGDKDASRLNSLLDNGFGSFQCGYIPNCFDPTGDHTISFSVIKKLLMSSRNFTHWFADNELGDNEEVANILTGFLVLTGGVRWF